MIKGTVHPKQSWIGHTFLRLFLQYWKGSNKFVWHACFVCAVPREQLLQTEEYDLNVVRLCFQVYLQDETGLYNTALPPIVSNPIYDNSKLP